MFSAKASLGFLKSEHFHGAAHALRVFFASLCRATSRTISGCPKSTAVGRHLSGTRRIMEYI